MPNPVRSIRNRDRLSKRQKVIVRKLRAARLPVKVYKRGRGLSVHNPFLDVRRTARVGSIGTTKTYPHARDTDVQRRLRHARGKVKGARKVSPKMRRSFLLP